MARPRSKTSKLSLGGLGMLPKQDERILFFLKENNIPSLKYLQRNLMRKWLSEQEAALTRDQDKKELKRVKDWEAKQQKK